MQFPPKEIELQTYSCSYAYPVNSSPILPYQWDGECHLVLNDRFYASGEPEQPENEHNFSFEVELKDTLELKEETPAESMAMEDSCSINMETCSVQSTEATMSNNGKIGAYAGKKGQNIDEQLDFIMESSKKHPKVDNADKKHRRNRKSKEQLDVLIQELDHLEEVDNDTIKGVATRTGLKEIQVYKWFWDRKNKPVPN